MSEGSTLLDAGNKIRTEAMQANIGEDLIIKGKNGVELLDAKETYEEKTKEKSSSIGVNVNVGFTPAQMVSTINDISNNLKDYGFDNTSQSINTIGNGIQDLRNITALTGNLYDGIDAGSRYLNGANGLNDAVLGGEGQRALSNLVSADVSLSYNKSSFESNTSGTTSVAGVINVGGNMIVQSEGDVKFVNQKITVGENIIIDAKNFEALAGENTYKNDTKSKSSGGSVGYDIVNQNMTGGLNVSGGNSNTTSKTYDNTTISAGGIFQLTTTEDATFKGANVIADKINFDIGKNLNIISLQDEYKSDGKSYGVGIDVSGEIPGTKKETGVPIPSFSGSYSTNSEDSKWVNNQTSIIAENGGNVKVGETLTNIGAIIGSLSEDNKLSIDANKVVIENLKDYNKGENKGAGISGISPETLVPQTSIQYGSHDKEQNTNATFVNTEITENGVKLDLEKLGINTDINKAQVITKDEVVEQIDTVLHTDMGNQKVRDQFVEDIFKTGALIPEIAQGIKEGINNPGETVLGQISSNMSERSDEIKAFIDGRDKKLDKELEKFKNEDGKISPDDEKVQKAISDSLKKTLEEFGKGDYEIVYAVGNSNYPMSIDDKNGILYVNVNGDGFGNPEEMRKNAQHEGGHGTYKDREIDETAAEKLGNKDKVLIPSNAVIDAGVIDKLKEGTEAYNIARENGDVRDKGMSKSNPYYKAAESTLNSKDWCNGKIECLGNLYKFSVTDAENQNTAEVGNKTIGKIVESAFLGIVFPAAPTTKIIVSGAKIFIDFKSIPVESIENYKKDIYLTAVAAIERERSNFAETLAKTERNEILFFISEGINSNNVKQYQETKKARGERVPTTKEIENRVWRYQQYTNSKNPDYYVQPRSLDKVNLTGK